MIKLIAIDLDGTLLSSDGTISKNNIEALHFAHQAGAKIVLCTGRPYLSMKEFVSQIQLNSDEDYIITFNGGQVQRASDGEIIKKHVLSQSDMLKWYQVANELNLPLNLIDGEFVYEPLTYPEGHPSIYLDERKNLVTKKLDFSSFDEEHEFNKLVICCTPSYLDQQITLIPKEILNQYSVFKSRQNLLEIVADGVTKGRILNELADFLSIDAAEIMAIGDQENDLSMIEFAGIGVAMGNSVESVINAAEFVTRDNNHDGVAHAICHYFK